MQNFGVFSKPQVLNLRRALTSIQLAGTEGFDHAVVMPGDVIDILLRCEAVQQRWLTVLLVAFCHLKSCLWCMVIMYGKKSYRAYRSTLSFL